MKLSSSTEHLVVPFRGVFPNYSKNFNPNSKQPSRSLYSDLPAWGSHGKTRWRPGVYLYSGQSIYRLFFIFLLHSRGRSQSNWIGFGYEQRVDPPMDTQAFSRRYVAPEQGQHTGSIYAFQGSQNSSSNWIFKFNIFTLITVEILDFTGLWRCWPGQFHHKQRTVRSRFNLWFWSWKL